MLFDHTPWCSVNELMEIIYPQQTPIPMLCSTPDATSIVSHNQPLWLSYPVASAGCANRPHPLGVGLLKWQLQAIVQLFCIARFQFVWSCHFKRLNKTFRAH